MHCIEYLEHFVVNTDSEKICRYLFHKETFQSFVYNLLNTIIFTYVLIREVIVNTTIPITYWILAHISAIVFSLLGEIQILQFSIDTLKTYTIAQLIIIIVFGSILLLLIIKQIIQKKVKYSVLIRFIIVYILIFLLFLSKSSNIIFHFHHSLIAGLLTLFFKDFSCKFDLYIHSIIIGIFVQGLNFFGAQEIFLFYISYINPPSLVYLLMVYGIFFIGWIILLLIRKYCCKNIENDELEYNIELYRILDY